jgi:hypothetical protein
MTFAHKSGCDASFLKTEVDQKGGGGFWAGRSETLRFEVNFLNASSGREMKAVVSGPDDQRR